MSFPAIEVEKREAQGRSRIRRLRATGKIPAVLYGHNDKNNPELVQLDEKSMRRYLEDGRKFFNVDGAASGQTQAYVAEVQVNELTDEILHVDLQRVESSDRVKLRIPLQIKGTPAGARLGGRLEVFLHNIRITCTPANILEEFILDVGPMEIGDRATLGSLKLPEGVRTIGQESTTVCIIHPPKGSRGPGSEAGEETSEESAETTSTDAPVSDDAPAES